MIHLSVENWSGRPPPRPPPPLHSVTNPSTAPLPTPWQFQQFSPKFPHFSPAYPWSPWRPQWWVWAPNGGWPPPGPARRRYRPLPPTAAPPARGRTPPLRGVGPPLLGPISCLQCPYLPDNGGREGGQDGFIHIYTIWGSQFGQSEKMGVGGIWPEVGGKPLPILLLFCWILW